MSSLEATASLVTTITSSGALPHRRGRGRSAMTRAAGVHGAGDGGALTGYARAVVMCTPATGDTTHGIRRESLPVSQKARRGGWGTWGCPPPATPPAPLHSQMLRTPEGKEVEPSPPQPASDAFSNARALDESPSQCLRGSTGVLI